MRLEEFYIGKTEESKRKAILKNLGRQVILEDDHESLCHALLIGAEGESYHVRLGDSRGDKRLLYHALQKLMILYPSQDNPLPQINVEKDFSKIPDSLIVYNDPKMGKKLYDLFNRVLDRKDTIKVKPKDLKKLLAKS